MPPYQVVNVEISTEQGGFAVDAGLMGEASVRQVPKVNLVVPTTGNNL